MTKLKNHAGDPGSIDSLINEISLPPSNVPLSYSC